MNLNQASLYADRITEWLAPYCETELRVAGSIRRARATCADVDIVCVPRLEIEKDMFDVVIKRVNLAHRFLTHYAQGGKCRIISGELEGKQMMIELANCQLDLWFASPETFATRLLCRTGSKEHNVWLCQRAKSLGMKWSPYDGVRSGGQWQGDEYVGGTVLPAKSEAEIYAQLKVRYIPAEYREAGQLDAYAL